MKIAAQIVARLLEDLQGNRKVCITCQSALGLPQQPGDSHGYCKRHAVQMQEIVVKNALKSGKERLIKLANDRMIAIQNTPAEKYPPDLENTR